MTTPVLLKLASICARLDTTRNGVRNIAARDNSFPKPLKMGSSKQAPVFYDAAEIEAWIEAKKNARLGEAANEGSI